MAVRWKTDFSKFVITSNFERRGWQEVEDEGDGWDIYWANVATARQVFSSSSDSLQAHQLINHFPNHYELTRKDLIVKNIKRYQRQARKAGQPGLPAMIPSTYVLPQDYALFVEEFRKNASNTYILKPNSKAQGKGIFLINKLSQVRQRAAAATAAALGAGDSSGSKVAPLFSQGGGSGGSSSSTATASTPLRPALENYVVSRYIENPLLLGGKKFDLRLYVLVVSFRPLVAYLSTLGFARFCNVKYTRELAELDNMFVHLTNVAVQKGGGSQYNSSHGNKWSLADLRLHLEATRGHAASAQLFADIQELVVHSLKAVQQVIINDRHCFSLYGFDVIIDTELKPWLIEVNASPSLTTTTKSDRLLKFKVINDALSIVTPPSWSSSKPGSRSGSASRDTGTASRHYPTALGSMQLIVNERGSESSSQRATGEAAEVPAAVPGGGSTAGSSQSWRPDDPRKWVVLHG